MELNDSNVEKVYNYIAKDFDTTRHKVWPSVSKFLDSLPKDSKILEVGCGNGKNMLYRKDLKFTGIDLSEEMIKICKSKGLHVYKANMLELPFLNRSFDYVISVASLHHLDSTEKRIKALNEMLRVLNDDGKLFVQVWANNGTLKEQDQMVPFKPKDGKGETQYRYYHLYNELELEQEFCKTDFGFKFLHSFEEKGNWGIIIEKLS